MAITLTIKGTPVTIPASGASPNWSPGIIEALQLLTDAINSVTGTYDVAPQAQNIDSNNASTNITINNLEFPPSEVRSATIFYSVHRITEDSGGGDNQEVAEGGFIIVTYNASNSVNSKWEISQYRSGDALITFDITDLGQMRFSTTALTGINHEGTLSYRAISVLNG